MASLLSNQYKSAFSTPSQHLVDKTPCAATVINDVNFNEADIEKAIDQISRNSAPGPDKFPAVMLQMCKEELCHPLYLIWRKSLDTGEVPEMLKVSNITPIYKDGPKKLPKNYRPVALTSHLVKCFEKVIRNALVKHIEDNNLMNPNQHGFRSGRSCLSQLLQHYDRIVKYLEEGKNVDVIYLDFSKAFDKLDFQLTLQKLHNLGVTGKIFNWLQSFLTNRKQCVYISGVKSSYEEVMSGVPQGSVVGPLLFLIMLGDIDAEVTTAHVASFADDTRMTASISHQVDTCALQADLDKIYSWAANNQASFNCGKFECLRYGTNKSIMQSSCYLSSNQSTIDEKSSVKDLGVIMSSDATFNEHISRVTTAASQKCGWVLRTFKTRECFPLIVLWKSLILPILDYCSQLWSPCAPGPIQAIEKVQVNYLRKISRIAHLDYWRQLHVLKLYSLQRRRERYICIYVWKIIEGIVPNFGIEITENRRRGRYCRVPLVKSQASHRAQTLRFNSMSVRGPRVFNCLPTSLRNMSGCSVQTFKKELDKHLNKIPDEPRVPGLVKFCSQGGNSLTDYFQF